MANKASFRSVDLRLRHRPKCCPHTGFEIDSSPPVISPVVDVFALLEVGGIAGRFELVQVAHYSVISNGRAAIRELGVARETDYLTALVDAIRLAVHMAGQGADRPDSIALGPDKRMEGNLRRSHERLQDPLGLVALSHFRRCRWPA